MSDITDELVGEFATYLGKFARSYCNINKPLLMYLTAHGYLSAFKNHFEAKVRNETGPKYFDPAPWSKLLASIYKEKADQAREGGFVSENDSCTLMCHTCHANAISDIASCRVKLRFSDEMIYQI